MVWPPRRPDLNPSSTCRKLLIFKFLHVLLQEYFEETLKIICKKRTNIQILGGINYFKKIGRGNFLVDPKELLFQRPLFKIADFNLNFPSFSRSQKTIRHNSIYDFPENSP